MSSYTRSQDKSHPVGSNYNDNLISQSWRVPAISVGTSIDSLVYNTRRFAKSPIPNVTLTPSQRIVAPPKPTNSNPPSVKHLTCYFWDKNKNCKWSDQECLYAHHATGKVASGPMQVEPGRPAVAGKNASNARPVYEDWRRGSSNAKFGYNANHSNISHTTALSPGIQEQIDYIAANATRVRAANHDSMLGISIPLRPRHQHEETSPTSAYTDRHGPLTSPSSTDSNVDQRVQTLAQTTQLLSMVVQHNHVLLNRAAGNLTKDMDTLEETFNELASGAIRSLSAPPISCLQKLAISKANLMSVIEELNAMADTVEATKRHVTAELDMIHLRALAAEWFTVD